MSTAPSRRGRAAAVCVLAVCAAVPATAAADRAGAGPVDAPHISTTRHVAFTLRGSGWAQVIGASGATPSIGSYARELDAARQCVVTVRLRATAVHGRPTVHGHTVQVRPPIRLKPNRLVYTRSGQHRAITWWLGSVAGSGSDVAVAGVQRAPSSIARAGTPWILYEAFIAHQRQSVAPRPSCVTAARAAEPAIALTIARTMHLAAGAPKATAPFSTA